MRSSKNRNPRAFTRDQLSSVSRNVKDWSSDIGHVTVKSSSERVEVYLDPKDHMLQGPFIETENNIEQQRLTELHSEKIRAARDRLIGRFTERLDQQIARVEWEDSDTSPYDCSCCGYAEAGSKELDIEISFSGSEWILSPPSER